MAQDSAVNLKQFKPRKYFLHTAWVFLNTQRTIFSSFMVLIKVPVPYGKYMWLAKFYWIPYTAGRLCLVDIGYWYPDPAHPYSQSMEFGRPHLLFGFNVRSKHTGCDSITRRIFQFWEVNKTANERKFLKICLIKLYSFDKNTYQKLQN